MDGKRKLSFCLAKMKIPEFMKRRDCRYLMLMHMSKGLNCSERFRKQILKYELECVYQCLIPIFYADNKKLGNGNYIDGYFEYDNQIYNRLQKLSLKDLELQKRIMEISFWPYMKKNKDIKYGTEKYSGYAYC